MTPFLPMRNGEALPRSRVPHLAFEEWRAALVTAPKRGRRVCALFAVPADRDQLNVFGVLAADGEGVMEVASARLPSDAYPSMTPECPQVHLFERELAETWGVKPKGHPWLKPVRFVHSKRPGHDAWSRADDAALVPGVMEFYRVEGEEVHEVAVGPVHAGVIEPGHFRFQCHGEQVFHLEISLGYQHRGVESAMVGGPGKRTIHYMETLAGDTTVGHATAYCQNVEALAGVRATMRGQALRAVGLELERLANHAGDLGALAGDVGFLPTASFCGRLRGDFLNLTALLCGSRFGRGLVRPGGAAFDVDPTHVEAALHRLDGALRDTHGAVELLWNSASVQARFEGTGQLAIETARDLGLVGIAARACGLKRDVRKSHPADLFRFAHIPVSTANTGDVFARARVRALEIQRSAAFLRRQLKELPAGEARRPVGPLRPDLLAVTLVEGWRGEICHVALTDAAGRFAAYKVIDPSFHNWFGVGMALRNQQISDFPLCNKSFNLSYCGFDL